MNHRTNRREFLRRTAITGAGVCLAASGMAAEQKPAPKQRPSVPPSERINIGLIGSGGRGGANLGGVLGDPGVNIVALCDVKESAFAGAIKAIEAAWEGPCKARRYSDWRKMLAG